MPGRYRRRESGGQEPEAYHLSGDQRYGDLQIKEDTTVVLIHDFLDCVKARRKPLCPLEDGHRATTSAHLGNISLELGRTLRWDPDKEVFPDDDEAKALLHYEYREPWSL